MAVLRNAVLVSEAQLVQELGQVACSDSWATRGRYSSSWAVLGLTPWVLDPSSLVIANWGQLPQLLVLAAFCREVMSNAVD